MCLQIIVGSDISYGEEMVRDEKLTPSQLESLSKQCRLETVILKKGNIVAIRRRLLFRFFGCLDGPPIGSLSILVASCNTKGNDILPRRLYPREDNLLMSRDSLYMECLSLQLFVPPMRFMKGALHPPRALLLPEFDSNTTQEYKKTGLVRYFESLQTDGPSLAIQVESRRQDFLADLELDYTYPKIIRSLTIHQLCDAFRIAFVYATEYQEWKKKHHKNEVLDFITQLITDSKRLRFPELDNSGIPPEFDRSLLKLLHGEDAGRLTQDFFPRFYDEERDSEDEGEEGSGDEEEDEERKISPVVTVLATPRLVITSGRIGLFAKQEIPKGTWIFEIEPFSTDNMCRYIIDDSITGNNGRYLHFSSKHNADFVLLELGGELRLFCKASKSIAIDSEIQVDQKLQGFRNVQEGGRGVISSHLI